ncbi:MAG TPA: sensor histidine kinase, partial [Clostridia bacterium]
GIVVIDSEHMIVSVNKTFTELFPLDYFNYAEGKSIDIFMESLGMPDAAVQNLGMITDIKIPYYNCELEINLPENRVFSIKSCNSNGNSEKYLGKFIMFQDITIYKNLLLDIEEKNSELAASNEELTSINDQLNEHISIMEELTLYKERNRIAREVHDTLGHTLMLLISHIIISKNIVQENPSESAEKLDEAIKIAQNALSEIRYSIKGLTSDENSPKNLVESIERLVEYSSISGINIQITVIGDEYIPPVSFSKKYYKIVETCTKICREAVTNAMRHGKAKEISIIIKFIDQKIRLYILDNGKGCTEIKKGLGITGMESRITETGGTIMYGSDGESGFHIQAELPVTFDTNE